MNSLKIINRVEKCAKLTDISGSVEKRTRVAAYRNKRLFLMTVDTIQNRVNKKSANIKYDEIFNNFRKIAEGVVIFIDKQKKNKRQKASALCEQIDGRITSIFGHTIFLPLKKVGKTEVLKEKDVYAFIHESRHVLDVASQPRMLASENRFSRLKKCKKSAWKFYEKNIYINHPNLKKKERVIPNLRKQIQDFFDERKISNKDRVTILQYWRYCMITERNAMMDDVLVSNRKSFVEAGKVIVNGKNIKSNLKKIGINFNVDKYLTKTDKLKALQKYSKAKYETIVKRIDEEDMFYTKKINLLIKLTSETIAKERLKMTKNK